MPRPAPGSALTQKPIDYARYFVAVFIVRQFTAVWMIYEFEWHVNEGRLSPMLLRPMNALWHYVSGHLGEQMADFRSSVILGLFFVLYPAALVAAFAGVGRAGDRGDLCGVKRMRFAMQFCFSMCNFWLKRASAIDQLTWLPYLFLSGMVIPLADMPARVRHVLYLTPFPYCIDFPGRILTRQLEWPRAEIFQGFAVMAAWFAGQAVLVVSVETGVAAIFGAGGVNLTEMRLSKKGLGYWKSSDPIRWSVDSLLQLCKSSPLGNLVVDKVGIRNGWNCVFPPGSALLEDVHGIPTPTRWFLSLCGRVTSGSGLGLRPGFPDRAGRLRVGRRAQAAADRLR